MISGVNITSGKGTVASVNQATGFGGVLRDYKTINIKKTKVNGSTHVQC